MQRQAQAEWKGGLKDGNGSFNTKSGVLFGNYSFSTRFENAKGTNPEELIGAAHAACFSMALAHHLEKKGSQPRLIETEAIVSLEKKENGYAITKIHLETKGDVSGLDPDQFQKLAEEAKENCPVSKALSSLTITVGANLLAESQK